MTYECQNCFSKFEESDNSVDGPLCPECGCFDVDTLSDEDQDSSEDQDFEGEGDISYGMDGTIDEE